MDAPYLLHAWFVKPWYRSKKIFVFLVQVAFLVALQALDADPQVLVILAGGAATSATAAIAGQAMEDRERARVSG